MRVPKITRPIIFFDTETTGTNPLKDYILELAIVKLHVDGEIEKRSRKFKPPIPIPASATKVHNITDEMVKDEHPFSKFAAKLLPIFEGCDIGGYNTPFDIAMLSSEFSRSGLFWDLSDVRIIDAQTIYKRNHERTLSAAVQEYLNKDHSGAHGALADAEASLDVFLAQLDHHQDIPLDLDELHLYCNYDKKRADLAGKFKYNDEGVLLVNFGPKFGEPVKDNKGLLTWIMEKDFTEDTKRIARRELGI